MLWQSWGKGGGVSGGGGRERGGSEGWIGRWGLLMGGGGGVSGTGDGMGGGGGVELPLKKALAVTDTFRCSVTCTYQAL